MLLIARCTQQIAPLSKWCKSMWILLHGLRINNTDIWNWVTKDFRRMTNVRYLKAHFNDNRSHQSLRQRNILTTSPPVSSSV